MTVIGSKKKFSKEPASDIYPQFSKGFGKTQMTGFINHQFSVSSFMKTGSFLRFKYPEPTVL
jgi:hypothetical protein